MISIYGQPAKFYQLAYNQKYYCRDMHDTIISNHNKIRLHHIFAAIFSDLWYSYILRQ